MSAVKYRLDGNVAVLEIDNPPVNATTINVREGLAEALKNAVSDPAVNALVLAGSNGLFLAGADINEISVGLNNKFPTLRDLQAQMEALPKPIVAAIQGVALGGGFELALTCHARLATPNAKVGMPEVKLGILPGAGGTQRFTRLAGPAAALEAITSGAQIPAARALELGLVDGLADDVVAEAIVFARQAAKDPRPLRLASNLAEKVEGVSRDLGIQRRQIPDDEILSRLLHPLVNEGAKIVEEGIAIRASDVDIVYVNGYGFPAYKGGPMFWAQKTGFEKVVETMRKLAPTHGQRWRPAPSLERMASDNG